MLRNMLRNKMQKQILKIFLLLLVFLIVPHYVLAAPVISDTIGSIIDDQAVLINGNGFGIKAEASPIANTNFDSEISGQVPSGWLSPQSNDCLVNGVFSRGSKSLDCGVSNWMGAEYFPRISLDLGRDIGTNSYLYFTLWLYLSEPQTQINWKGPLLSSSMSPSYWVNTSPTTNNATGIGSWYDPNYSPDPRWFNTAIAIQYSQDNNPVFNYCTAGNGSATDSYLFGQWQRIEYTIKTSSAPAVNDGFVKVERLGKATPATDATGCITHGNSSDPWRYFSLPQGITNIASTPFSMQMFFDDLYIDNSLARVELCDASSWSARTHCEIQKPTAWSDSQIGITLNQGEFSNDDNAYLYIMDENGNVNEDGYVISFIDNIAPSAPTGLGVE